MNTSATLRHSIRNHWPEYLMEAGSLACFMISACLFTALLYHPASPFYHAISNEFVRRMLTGIAMGLTLIAIVFSPWGKQSGAHLNPSFTWTFYRLKKIRAWDALFYSIAQFAGGILGVVVSAFILRNAISHPAVQHVVTVPGPLGVWVALMAEITISFVLMLTVLFASNTPAITRYTAFFAGTLVALYITFEAPYSGMSMNPARTLGSAFSASRWTSLWVYFLAPILGMFLAAETYVRLRGPRRVYCAKYDHQNNKRCIFLCNYGELMQIAESSSVNSNSMKGDKRMFRKTLVLALAFGVLSSIAFADHATLFKVRVENVSTATTLKSSTGEMTGAGLSPGLFFLFSGHNSDIFVAGHPDHGMGLESQAEDGNPAMLAESLRKHKGVRTVEVFNTPLGMDNPGPIGPGGAYEFTFSANPGTKLMITEMFGQSNDLFYAPDPKGIDLFDHNGNPIQGDITSQFVLWDAGTEVNQEPGFGPDQAPRQKEPNTGESEKKAVGTVEDDFMYPPTSRVIKITISHQ